jgi:hypothetical protein
MITSDLRFARAILGIGLLVAAVTTTRADDWFKIPSSAVDPPTRRVFDLVELLGQNTLPCNRGSVAQRVDCLNLELLRQARELHSLRYKLEQIRKPHVTPLGSSI